MADWVEGVEAVDASKKIDRRRFLRAASGIAAGAVAFPYVVPSSVLGAGAPSGKIAMGCIGVGAQGTGNMNGFLNKSDARVIAVCDVDKGHREAAKRRVDSKYGNSDCATYHDFRELIARDDIDALSLALPDHWHAIPVIAAARAGKDMYGEKPLARTIGEGKAMVEAVQHYGRIWQTGSWQRSVEQFPPGVRTGHQRSDRQGQHGRGGATHRRRHRQSPPSHRSRKASIGISGWDRHRGNRSASTAIAPRIGTGAGSWTIPAASSPTGPATTSTSPTGVSAWTGPGRWRSRARASIPATGCTTAPTQYKFVCKYANGIVMTVANDRQVPKGMGDLLVRREREAGFTSIAAVSRPAIPRFWRR